MCADQSTTLADLKAFVKRGRRAQQAIDELIEPTWNYCPDCHRAWTDRIPTPGVVRRSKQCTACRRKATAR